MGRLKLLPNPVTILLMRTRQPKPLQAPSKPYCWLLLLLLLPSLQTQAQSLNGRVVIGPRETDPPLGQVRIDVQGFSGQVSDPETGVFSLSLPGLHPGEQVRLNIQKEGYAVINQQALQPFLPRNPLTQLVIHMAPISERDQMAIEFYQIRIEQKIDETFQAELQELMAKRVAEIDADRISQLATERDMALAQTKRMAEALARVDLNNASTLFQRAFSHFPDQIDSVLLILEEDILDTELQKAEEVAAKARASKTQTIEGYMLRAQALVIESKFLLAQRNFQKAIDADSTHVDHLLTFGSYLTKQTQFQQAIELFQMALRHTDAPGTRGHLLNSLGLALVGMNRYQAALDAYEESVRLFRQESQPTKALANTLNNLGNAYSDLSRYPEAISTYQEALEIKRRLALSNPQSLRPEIANTLSNVAITYADLNRYPEAISAQQEALDIRRQLAAERPQRYAFTLANSLNNLGNHLFDLNRFEEALTAYLEALTIRKQLAAQNPHRFQPEVARLQFNLGNCYLELNRFDEALPMFQDALAFHRQANLSNPQHTDPVLADILNAMGSAYHPLNRFEEALPLHEEALLITRQLTLEDPQRFNPSLVNTLNNLGITYYYLRRFSDALPLHEEAAIIGRRLVQQNAQRFEQYLAKTLNNLAMSYTELNRFEKAISVYEEALTINRNLTTSNEQRFAPDLASTLNNLGLAYGRLHQYRKAQAAYQEALAIWQWLSQDNPDSFTLFLVYPMFNLAELARTQLVHSGDSIHRSTGLAQLTQVDMVLLQLPDIPFTAYIHSMSQELSNFFQQADLREIHLLAPTAFTKDSLEQTDSLPEKIRLQQQIIAGYDKAIQAYPQAPTVQDSLEQGLGQLAHWQILNGDYQAAQNNAMRCLHLKGASLYAARWLPLTLLLQGEFAEAEQHYQQQAGQPCPMEEGELFRDIFLSDLEELTSAGITHPDMAKIRALLTN